MKHAMPEGRRDDIALPICDVVDVGMKNITIGAQVLCRQKIINPLGPKTQNFKERSEGCWNHYLIYQICTFWFADRET